MTVPEEPIEFRLKEAETVRKVLDRIDQLSAKRIKEGFSKRNFMLGVLNCLLLTFVFAKYPQHFWLFYLIELSFLIPLKMYNSFITKPLNEVLYYLDYCWVMNIFGILVCIALFLDALTNNYFLSEDMRQELFLTIYGISCGPLLGATILLPFVAVVFHDYMIMTGLFIHILPPAVMYTLHWYYQDIHNAWPKLFQLSYMEDIQFFPDQGILFIPFTGLGTVAGNTIAFYFLWFIPYVIWMHLIGLDLPRKNRKSKDGTIVAPMYDTVFHATVRNGLTAVAGKALWGRPASLSKVQMLNDDYETRDFLAYMAFHALLACSSVYILAYPCYKNQTVHSIMLIVLTVLCVARGAARYTYYVTQMYSSAVRKDFAALLLEAEKNK